MQACANGLTRAPTGDSPQPSGQYASPPDRYTELQAALKNAQSVEAMSAAMKDLQKFERGTNSGRQPSVFG